MAEMERNMKEGTNFSLNFCNRGHISVKYL